MMLLTVYNTWTDEDHYRAGFNRTCTKQGPSGAMGRSAYTSGRDSVVMTASVLTEKDDFDFDAQFSPPNSVA
jgi:hypothetical protein